MATDTLYELLSEPRVKVMRLFLRNPQEMLDTRTIAERTDMDPALVRGEIRLFLGIGFLKPAEDTRTAREKKAQPKPPRGFSLNPDFEFLRPLRTLLLCEAPPVTNARIAERLRTLGNRVKLVMISGALLGLESARTDLFLVGEGIPKTRLERFIRSIEADFGCALNYVYFTVEEYDYRTKMSDHFLRDIFSLPHETLVDRLEAKKT